MNIRDKLETAGMILSLNVMALNVARESFVITSKSGIRFVYMQDDAMKALIEGLKSISLLLEDIVKEIYSD